MRVEGRELGCARLVLDTGLEGMSRGAEAVAHALDDARGWIAQKLARIGALIRECCRGRAYRTASPPLQYHRRISKEMSTIDRETSALLLVDFQSKLMPTIDGGPSIVANARRLLAAAHMLDVPVLITEQNADGLGATLPEL
jgi:Isochorismatase family